MIIPIRCFTCNFLISSKYKKFLSMREEKEEPKTIFEKLKIRRYCCKKTLLSHVDIIDSLDQNKVIRN